MIYVRDDNVPNYGQTLKHIASAEGGLTTSRYTYPSTFHSFYIHMCIYI